MKPEQLLQIFDLMKQSWAEKHERGICFICGKPYEKCKCGKVSCKKKK
jgi:hypothetical protein